MRFGVIALPDHETSRRIVAYSQAIAAVSAPLMSLGEGAPPHMTLLHVDGSAEAVRALWTDVRDLDPTMTLDSDGVAFSPLSPGDFYVPEGGVSVSIGIVRRPDLDRLHRRVLDLATTRGVDILGRVGDDFRPHITLNVLERFPAGEVMLPEALLAGRFTATPALGRLGDYGTFPEIVETASAGHDA